MYCSNCKNESEYWIQKDGNGHNEYWGYTNNDMNDYVLSDCCDYPVYKYVCSECSGEGFITTSIEYIDGLILTFGIPCECCNGIGLVEQLEPEDFYNIDLNDILF